ncbi:MAG TPA: nitroreductase family protein [Anaerolineales bacterium]|nr:nitroreductase family protein [Anaerolineales bacterium]
MLAPEDLHGWLRSRRSVRRFREDPVPAETVTRILETATWAPNAHNRQPWRFVQLSSRESREVLAGAMGAEFRKTLQAEGLSAEEISAQLERSRARILEAPEAILLCLDIDVLDKYDDPARTQGEYLMGVQSVALAGGQLLLAAHAEGLAGVWICSPLFTPIEVSQALGLPESWQAQGLILVGYPIKVPDERPRNSVSHVTKIA